METNRRNFVRAVFRATEARERRAPPKGPAQPKAENVAVIVCHGMGQQVPFETIDGVARLLRKEIRLRSPRSQKANAGNFEMITTSIVNVNDLKLGRAELQYQVEHGKTINLHVYEAYWAPLTAGKISTGDVFGFLKDAGLRGLTNTRESFDRFMFGGWQRFRVARWRTGLLFGVVLGALLSLALMSSTIIAVGAARTITQGVGLWPSSELMADLTCDFGLFGIVTALLGLLLWAAWYRERIRNQKNDGTARRDRAVFLNHAVRITLALTIAAAIATGLLVAWHLALHRGGQTAHWWKGAFVDFIATSSIRSTVVVFMIWVVVFYLNNKAREFFVEYIGDVAAYIAPHTVNKFFEIRQTIQKRALDVARAVYSLKSDDQKPPLYKRVVVVGHSLGSVVAYDTLNALFLDEETRGYVAMPIRKRTSHLITFGSPLDKTAFVFREQQPRDSQVREAIAANVQPLILDYLYRKDITWINIWSSEDPISGRLDYYDAAEGDISNSRRVKNYRDLYCNIPLVAHTMYWQSPCVGAVLLAAVENRSCSDAVHDSGFAK